MTVEWQVDDEPDSRWLLKIISTDNDEEEILVAINGAVFIRNLKYGHTFEAWPGFPEEPPIYDYIDEEEE